MVRGRQVDSLCDHWRTSHALLRLPEVPGSVPRPLTQLQEASSRGSKEDKVQSECPLCTCGKGLGMVQGNNEESVFRHTEERTRFRRPGLATLVVGVAVPGTRASSEQCSEKDNGTDCIDPGGCLKGGSWRNGLQNPQ